MMLAWIVENVNLINMLQSSAIYFLWTAYCQSSFDLSSLGNDDLAYSVLLHFLLGDSCYVSEAPEKTDDQDSNKGAFKNSICKNDFTYLESTKIFCRAFASSDNICYDVKINNIPKMKQAVKHFLIKRI